MTERTEASEQLAGLSAVKLAVMAQQARARVGALARSEPVAIVGMGCRFPGSADSPEHFWDLLRSGVDAVGELPRDRWDVDAVFDPDPATPGKSSVTAGGFLDRVDGFDAAFFGIMRREAERMDPQHRLFLEVAIEALDHAGLPRERLAGSATGVFIASYFNDYANLQYNDPESIDGRTLTGTLHSVLANRLSYLLDLRGPSLSVDTACSSSLVAVHLAVQSLRTGDSDVALAGGVSLMLSPDLMIALSKVGFMSPSGRCHTFDAKADGFIRGEGCGVVVLKRLADALSDRDRVLAVVRGSAVNQDGHSTVISAPNGLAQQALIRDALENAQLTPDRVGFVEAHGTGTPLGDPIEVEALAATVGAPRPDGGVCYLGSVKANVGHLEAAAGVAGLIKATLALGHAAIPGQPHFTALSPHLQLDGTCLAVADAHRVWPAESRPRVAGVSSFGIGGTNAHVVLEEAPALAPDPVERSDRPELLALSAASPAALRELAMSWIYLLGDTSVPLAQLAATAGARRSHYDHRLALVGHTTAQLAGQLRGFVEGDAASSVAVGRCPDAGKPRVGFVFSGQGAQWARMGYELAESDPVFGGALDAVDRYFEPLAGWSLRAELEKPEGSSRLHDTEVAQPAIFAVQVALAALWESWGICPDAVVGHSIGELAALHVAGVLSLEEATRVVWHRGRIMQQATGLGRMVAVGLTASEAQELIDELGVQISVAAINARRSVVLAGPPEAVERAMKELDRRQVPHRALPVAYAFHSAQMEPFGAELMTAIGSVEVRPARLAVFSTVTGGHLDHRQVDAAHFRRNMRDTVDFAGALESMLVRGVDVFVELAPHPVLTPSIAECMAEQGQVLPIVASLRRGHPDRETMLRACAGVYAAGGTLRWDALTVATTPADLPTYPWQRERYWLREPPAAAPAPHKATNGQHQPLLGSRLATVDGTTAFVGAWPTADLAWVADHVVGDQVVMPGAGLLEALRLAAATTADANASLVDVVINRPLVLTAGDTSNWRTLVTPTDDGADLAIWSVGEDEGLAHCVASARTSTARPSGVLAASPEAPGEWHDDPEALYAAFAGLGMHFGPTFRALSRWRLGDGGGEADFAVPRHNGDHGPHPVALDGALQLCLLVATSRDGVTPSELYLPLAVESYTVFPADTPCTRVEVRAHREGAGGSVTAQARLFGEEGHVVAALDGIRLAPVDVRSLAAFGPAANDLYEVQWHADPEPHFDTSPGDASGAWIVLGSGRPGRALVHALSAAGGRCLEVRPGDISAHEDASAWTVAPGDRGAIEACIADDSWRDGRPLRGVVHAWSLDGDEGADDELRDWLVTGSALHLVQALGRHGGSARLWLATRGAQPAQGAVTRPHQAGLWGLAAAVACEYPELGCSVVDLDDADDPEDASALVRELLSSRATPSRVAWRGGTRYTPSLRRYQPGSPSVGSRSLPAHARLSVASAGTLDGLAWEAVAARTPGPGEVQLRVLAAGLNFRDVLLALGMYPGEGPVLGAECAGVVEAVGEGVSGIDTGDVVFGFAPGSLSTDVTVPAAFLRPTPAGLSIEEAAALPVAFLTSMYGLDHVAQVTPGTRVLIHAAAGGVGLAAVQLARRRGAEVFATVSTPDKRRAVHALGVDHVFDSRSTRFAEDLLAATQGKGVDVVLNSLSGEFIPASLRCLARGGWFLELGKREVWSPEQVRSERPDVRYRAFDLGEEAHADHGLLHPMLDELADALADGTLRPLPVRTYDMEDAPAAFRWMAQARHIGKLVLRAPRPAGQAHTDVIRSDATYWITGGAGALGLRTARWMVEAGARHVVLTGRTPPGPQADEVLAQCRARGARVDFRIADAADQAAMTAVRDEISTAFPPLRGVVHAAGALDDGMLVHQTWDRWRSVLQGKARGARVLDALTRDVSLDFFVLYSSAGPLLGPVGQGPYAAANAELDALAWARRRRGLPALSVSWGQWAEAGMAVRLRAEGRDVWSERGLNWLDPDAAFGHLERLLQDDAVHAVVLPIRWDRFLSQLPEGVDRSFFTAVAPTGGPPPIVGLVPRAPVAAATVIDDWRAAPASERRRTVIGHVASLTRQVLDIEADVELDERVALKEAGLDSLMAVELRNVLTRSLGRSLPATLLFDHPSLDALANYLLQQFDLVPPSTTAEPVPVDDDGEDLAALTDEEAEALLLAELGEPEGAA